MIPFPRQARRKYPPYAARVVAIRRTADDRTLTILTGSGAMHEAECRYHDDLGRLDEFGQIRPQTLWAALPYERNPSGYEWDFCAGLDVAIVTFGTPETDISLLHLAGVVLAASAAHVVVRLAARIEILRRDDGGAVWRMH
ncbi:hypothetical protein [Methylocaldum sp. GT1TLB]|uniref:hypothetical protein n=1 Tax=Methylocaldum sp. GT1TLB TaxID=3438965 RepID=UPI003DA09266